jgi:hypothetical protein
MLAIPRDVRAATEGADRPRGPTTLGQQVVAWLAAFAELAEDGGKLPALGAAARALRAWLVADWPTEVAHLPAYPAFAGATRSVRQPRRAPDGSLLPGAPFIGRNRGGRRNTAMC